VGAVIAPRATAVVAPNDVRAIGMLERLAERRVTVPKTST
jgi:DNA-binding LacI/PurR family transcriptional regulator